MAWFPNVTKREIRPGANDPAINVVGAILHVDAGNAYSLFDYFNGPSGGIESHFHIRKDGTCLAPHHRVLTADLRWVALGDIQAGDTLVGFDENAIGGARRSYRTSRVEWVDRSIEETYAVVLDDERVFYTTADHRWLSRNVENEERRVYTGWRQTAPAGTTRTLRGASVVELLPTWDTADDFESGWVAGILDGEGSLSAHHRTSVAQRPTVVLDRLEAYLKANEIDYSTCLVKSSSDCVSVQINDGLAGNLSLLGRLRPSRLLSKVEPNNFGVIGGQDRRVVAVYPVGQREIVKMQTSTRTFIADGIGMHNCEQYRSTGYEADANYKANSFLEDGQRKGYVSIETQGLEHGEWTDAQVASIKTLLTWLAKNHGFPLRQCRGPRDPGVGFHTMFGAPGPWTPVAKSCPGPDRKKQFASVLVPWMAKVELTPTVKPPATPPVKPPVKPPAKESSADRTRRLAHQRFARIKNQAKRIKNLQRRLRNR